jgi:hypothetical protein
MMNLYVERGVLPADQMVWLNNPPCEIAKALYAELA